MIPRIDVLALDASSTIEEAIKVIQDSGHSRMPVYQDVIDNIIGDAKVMTTLMMERR